LGRSVFSSFSRGVFLREGPARGADAVRYEDQPSCHARRRERALDSTVLHFTFSRDCARSMLHDAFGVSRTTPRIESVPSCECVRPKCRAERAATTATRRAGEDRVHHYEAQRAIVIISA
jgi:hypothetical protein